MVFDGDEWKILCNIFYQKTHEAVSGTCGMSTAAFPSFDCFYGNSEVFGKDAPGHVCVLHFMLGLMV